MTKECRTGCFSERDVLKLHRRDWRASGRVSVYQRGRVTVPVLLTSRRYVLAAPGLVRACCDGPTSRDDDATWRNGWPVSGDGKF